MNRRCLFLSAQGLLKLHQGQLGPGGEHSGLRARLPGVAGGAPEDQRGHGVVKLLVTRSLYDCYYHIYITLLILILILISRSISVVVIDHVIMNGFEKAQRPLRGGPR